MSNNLKETLPFERSKGENTAIVLFFKSFEEIPVFQIFPLLHTPNRCFPYYFIRFSPCLLHHRKGSTLTLEGDFLLQFHLPQVNSYTALESICFLFCTAFHPSHIKNLGSSFWLGCSPIFYHNLCIDWLKNPPFSSTTQFQQFSILEKKKNIKS